MQVDHASNSSWEDESSTMPVAVGDILDGKYRIVRVLGKGGMGVVMAAVHVELGHRVALKFLSRSGAQNEETLARFAREARAAAMIQSEHATRVLDIGRLVGGEPYMVLEMLEGCDLGALVTRQGPLSIQNAVTYVLEACEAIAEAHSLGIVHRDVKPDNLFLVKRPDGTKIVKLLDFGISKFSKTPAGKLENSPSLTTTSTIIGSPMYMSPEQLRATRDVDHRADIWSLGVTLYELISGQIPFPWRSLAELSAAILKDPPVPLCARIRSVPPELDKVITRCLEKNPADRYHDVAELAYALVPFGGPSAEASAEHAAQLLARNQTTRPEADTRRETLHDRQTSKDERAAALAARMMSLTGTTTHPAGGTSTIQDIAGLGFSRPSRGLRILPFVMIGMTMAVAGAGLMQFGPWSSHNIKVSEARRGIATSIAQLPITISTPREPRLQNPALIPVDPPPALPPTAAPLPTSSPPSRVKSAPAGAASVRTNTPAPVVKPNPFADRE